MNIDIEIVLVMVSIDIINDSDQKQLDEERFISSYICRQ